MLLPTKATVLACAREVEGAGIEKVEPLLLRAAGRPFCNRSPLAFSAPGELRGIDAVKSVVADPANVAQHVRSYLPSTSRAT